VSARGKARKRALDVLYESDLRGVGAQATLDYRTELARIPASEQPPLNDYTGVLVQGVIEHWYRIDQLITEYSDGWTIERMPPVDRALLRIALYELLWSDDVPPAVVIDEAVELAKSLSTDESPRFVNGLLGRILRDSEQADLRFAAQD
jgi:N utilization substance protein B